MSSYNLSKNAPKHFLFHIFHWRESCETYRQRKPPNEKDYLANPKSIHSNPSTRDAI